MQGYTKFKKIAAKQDGEVRKRLGVINSPIDSFDINNDFDLWSNAGLAIKDYLKHMVYKCT
jgi:hypothetical protein